MLMSYSRRQKKHGNHYTNGTKAYDLDLREATPTRLVAQAIILSRWLGYRNEDNDQYLYEEEFETGRRIDDAYQEGKNGYEEYKKN